MTEDVIKDLEKQYPSEFHNELLESTKSLVKRSRGVMSRYYEDWDLQDQVYRGERFLDADDKENERKGKPTKMVVPNTFAQVQTFASFLFLMFNQNKRFFELDPLGGEDYGTKKEDSELLLEQNLKRNQWNQLLFQHLLDVARFGPGILECSWTRKLSRVFVTPDPSVINISGVEATLQPGSGWQDLVKYEGNEIRAVSPYRFFPDFNFPLCDFRRSKTFCAAEEDFSMQDLYDLESVGEVAGVKFIEGLPRNLNDVRGGQTRSSVIGMYGGNGKPTFDSGNPSHCCIVTKCQRWIVPSEFKVDGNRLGQEEFPVLYHIWYANDNRLIRAEPAMWWHDNFGWSASQFTPDMHRTINLGLTDLIYRLQDVISWFINSHITSVRRVIGNRLIVNPMIIDSTTLDGEGDIYVRKGVSRPIKDGFEQLKVQDVTGGHMADADLLGKIMEMVTGVNGNAMGQYNSGRRSAQEARVVTAGAAGRMKMHGHLIFEQGLAPLASMMLSNLRQSLSMESFVRVIGQEAMTKDPNRYAAFKGTPEEVVCGDDYFTFDSTLASEKGFIAQSLQELLVAVMSNPVAAQQLDIDPRAMLEEIQFLRGAGPISRFSLSKRVASGQATPLPPMPVQKPAIA